jgi:alpha-mannosidase
VPVQCGASAALRNERSMFCSSQPSVIIDTVKVAEDDARTLVLRIYEAFGGSCSAAIYSSIGNIVSASVCNLLEEDDQPLVVTSDANGSSIVIDNMTPFAIRTIKIRL